MKIRTIAMMLTLLVAGLVIGCSSTPEAPAAPAAPVPNLSEKEALSIARSSDPANWDKCWGTTDKSYEYALTNIKHTESASFKPSGIWVVAVKSSWDWEHKYSDRTGSTEWPCTYVVNDATGRVTQN